MPAGILPVDFILTLDSILAREGIDIKVVGTTRTFLQLSQVGEQVYHRSPCFVSNISLVEVMMATVLPLFAGAGGIILEGLVFVAASDWGDTFWVWWKGLLKVVCCCCCRLLAVLVVMATALVRNVGLAPAFARITWKLMVKVAMLVVMGGAVIISGPTVIIIITTVEGPVNKVVRWGLPRFICCTVVALMALTLVVYDRRHQSFRGWSSR